VERKVPTIAEVQALAEEMPENFRVAITLAAWGHFDEGRYWHFAAETSTLSAPLCASNEGRWN
jgi:hypothetical protein